MRTAGTSLRRGGRTRPRRRLLCDTNVPPVAPESASKSGITRWPGGLRDASATSRGAAAAGAARSDEMPRSEGVRYQVCAVVATTGANNGCWTPDRVSSKPGLHGLYPTPRRADGVPNAGSWDIFE
ncbi:hypothetical protein MRX96_004860 [Rhipicephalus microplus]